MDLIIEVPVLVAAKKKMPMMKVAVEDPHAGEVRVNAHAHDSGGRRFWNC
jgi:Zn-dependent alcohol dehydrogenase